MGTYSDLLDAAKWPSANDWSDMVVKTSSLPTNPKLTAGDILKEAHDIVVGARNTTHGEKERSFGVIAQLWQVYLDGRKDGGPVTPFDVAQMMVLLKIGRSIQGTRIKDHMVDAAGYSGVAGELM